MPWDHFIVFSLFSLAVVGTVGDDVEMIDGTMFEFVSAGGFEQRLGNDSETVDGFPIRWRDFGPLEPENMRIRLSESREAAEPLVSTSVKQLTRIPDDSKVDDAMFAGQDVTLDGDTIDLTTAINQLHRRHEYCESCALSQLPFG